METSYTILYVDDDHDDLTLITEAFEKYTDHLRVVNAYNGVEALQTLNSMHVKGSLPCLIILDINMPLMDGKEALKAIKSSKSYQKIPVVMFSTSNSLSDKEFAENLGQNILPNR